MSQKNTAQNKTQKKKEKVIGLIDCNNFFVSCERVFNPKIRNKPTMVLSSNDGCVIARSQEVKNLGVAMGIPVFKIKNQIRQEKININSSNFELYRDMSSRVMNILREFVDDVQVYSIDEAFLDLTKYEDPVAVCENLKAKVTQYTGIPVSIGIAKTKTLAKLANKVAKKSGQVFYIKNNEIRVETLKQIEVSEIWGVGRKHAEKLKSFKIYNALDFQNQSDEWLRKQFSISGLNTVRELRGQSVSKIEEKHEMRKSIISSRSFGQPVTKITELKESIVRHVENVCAQLRSEGGAARNLTICISTGFYQNGNYHKSEIIDFGHGTDNTMKMVKQIGPALQKIYKPGFRYKKAGVTLTNITSKKDGQQADLFGETKKDEDLISSVLDKINARFGSGSIQIASSGITEKSRPNSKFHSGHHTTRWDEIMKIG